MGVPNYPLSAVLDVELIIILPDGTTVVLDMATISPPLPNDVNGIFKPIEDIVHTPEKLGYKLFWEDNFNGNSLDLTKWAPRGIGPRASGYVSLDAINVKNGNLELAAFVENDSIKVGAVGTNSLFMSRVRIKRMASRSTTRRIFPVRPSR